MKRTRNLGLQGSRFGIAAAFLANSGRIGPAGDVMTALTLRRSDPIRNMHRYYRLDVQLDLFGAGASSASGPHRAGRTDPHCPLPHLT